MIDLPNGAKLIESAAEMWALPVCNAEELFLDIESQRNFDHPDIGGLYPVKGDRIAGLAIAVNDEPGVYYIPVRHTGFLFNVPVEEFQPWLKQVLGTAKRWINHHIFTDMLFCEYEGATFDGELIDTLTMAKVQDSDRMDQDLKTLCREILGMPMEGEREIKAYLAGIKSKSYADVPPDLLGNYAGDDIIGVRRLYRDQQAKRPDEVAGIWAVEIQLAQVLADMERVGLQVKKTELKFDRMGGLNKLIQLSTDISALAGREFTNSHACIFDILINQLGLPVLATKWEKDPETNRLKDTGRPSFDKKAMALYEVHPAVTGDPNIKLLFAKIMEYRKEAMHQSFFVAPFLELMDEYEVIHPTYNPVVRTGRMSCSRPNAQQQNKRSKALIHPHDGYGFISCDYSQVEFRLIAHYIEDPEWIAAYNNDPDTDAHKWVAEMMGVKRKAGKTLNFGMAYGAGKAKVTAELAANPDIIEDVGIEVNAMIERGEIKVERRNSIYQQLCRERAVTVYAKYHEKIPGLRRTSRQAEHVCRRRGYIRNAYGRRRHLPTKAAHKAFNSLIQGCAMDLIKERIVALSPRYNAKMKAWGIRIVANVHDEVLFEVPLALLHDPEVQSYICDTLESPSIKFAVPIKVGLGISDKCWAIASGDDCYLADGTVVDVSKKKLPEDHAAILAGKIR